MEMGLHWGMVEMNNIIGNNPYEQVKIFKYLSPLLTGQNCTHEEIRCRHKTGDSC